MTAHCQNPSCSATLDYMRNDEPTRKWQIIDGELLCERCYWAERSAYE